MERRHQVFISSTFTDLVEERRQVIEALLEMDAIPAGMELFAAGNVDQWTLIKQVINQSDYYIVIVGGRYGSTTAEGVSYTEMEYDYALERGLPVMGFVHRDPNAIPAGKTELDPLARARLDAFREKVKLKIVKEYSTPAELGGVVSRGLIKLQRDFERPGWVRGDRAMTPDTEAHIAELRAELAELRQSAAEQSHSRSLAKIDGLASGEDAYYLNMRLTGKRARDANLHASLRRDYVWNVSYRTTWNEILQQVGPSLIDEASETEITDQLTSLGRNLARQQIQKWPKELHDVSKSSVTDGSVSDVLVQLFALNLITRGAKKRTTSDRNRYWVLTPAGQDQVMRLRAIKRLGPDELLAHRRTELTSMTVVELRSLAIKVNNLDGKGKKAELVEAILDAERASLLDL